MDLDQFDGKAIESMVIDTDSGLVEYMSTILRSMYKIPLPFFLSVSKGANSGDAHLVTFERPQLELRPRRINSYTSSKESQEQFNAEFHTGSFYDRFDVNYEQLVEDVKAGNEDNIHRRFLKKYSDKIPLMWKDFSNKFWHGDSGIGHFGIKGFYNILSHPSRDRRVFLNPQVSTLTQGQTFYSLLFLNPSSDYNSFLLPQGRNTMIESPQSHVKLKTRPIPGVPDGTEDKYVMYTQVDCYTGNIIAPHGDEWDNDNFTSMRLANIRKYDPTNPGDIDGTLYSPIVWRWINEQQSRMATYNGKNFIFINSLLFSDLTAYFKGYLHGGQGGAYTPSQFSEILPDNLFKNLDIDVVYQFKNFEVDDMIFMVDDSLSAEARIIA